MQKTVIVSAMRSAICQAGNGQLAHTRPDNLLTELIKESLSRVPQIDWHEIGDVIIGCATPEGEQGLNIAASAAVMAGIPAVVPAVTVNRNSASSLTSVMIGTMAIQNGMTDIIVAGGVESRSRVPFAGFNPSPAPDLLRSYPKALTPLGVAAENISQKYNISRKHQDEYAAESHRKALAAWDEGRFAGEVVTIRTVDGEKNAVAVTRDDGPRDPEQLELESLNPAFINGGSVTLGNSASPADAAAVVVLMSQEKALALGISPLASIRSMVTMGCLAEIKDHGAILAARKALEKAGVTRKDLDAIELGESSAAAALACRHGLKLEDDCVINTKGGSVALGLAPGAEGARVLCTLVHDLISRDLQLGLLTMGTMGGQGAAMILERD